MNFWVVNFYVSFQRSNAGFCGIFLSGMQTKADDKLIYLWPPIYGGDHSGN